MCKEIKDNVLSDFINSGQMRRPLITDNQGHLFLYKQTSFYIGLY